MNILVDVMGSENGPEVMIRGAVSSLAEAKGFDVTLLGDQKVIEGVLSTLEYDKERLHICATTEVIDYEDVPTKAIKNKTDSSMVRGFNLLVEGEGDAFISAGNSGALLTGAVLIVKRMEGVERPALGAIIPSTKGKFLLLDAGLNTACRPEYYLQFAHLGRNYARAAMGIEDPRIGLLNIGTEEEKGSEEVREAFKLLKRSGMNFVGNIEGKEIFDARADILLSDGFTGNVCLKVVEGTAKYLFKEMKEIMTESLFTKVAGAMLKKRLTEFKHVMDTDVNGGAPILGIKGLVLKTHGNSTEKTIKYVVLRAQKLAEIRFIESLGREMADLKKVRNQTEEV